MKISSNHSIKLFVVLISLGGIILLLIGLNRVDPYTSSDSYCASCHVHDHSHTSFLQSVHHSDTLQNKVGCIDCHLPPHGKGFYKEKIKAGIRDVYAYHFKDSSTYYWEQKSQVDYAVHHTFKTSCINCNHQLFPIELSTKGEQAHWHYYQNQKDMHCIQCHINVGHGSSKKMLENYTYLQAHQKRDTIYLSSAKIHSFNAFTETIPDSDVSFKMVTVKGGIFTDDDKQDTIVDFFMGEIEVSWDEYLQFLSETESEGRIEEQEVDGITGATPPWGNPDQGWGLGKRPAITMTHYAARVYCQWLTYKTGKPYRLPTEKEWSYTAANAYENIEKSDSYINTNKQYTLEPDKVKPDNLGLKHLLGNVKEFCIDSYESMSKEYVIKGGSFKSKTSDLSPALRESTQHKHWLKTDPQMPKSIWWYSDCNDVGFRVVLTYSEGNNEK